MALLRCNSSSDIYPLHNKNARPHSGDHQALHAYHTTELWHARLGHPGTASLHRILNTFGFSCSKSDTHTCHACRLSKHVRLPFFESTHVASFPFQLLHCDVWTSPIISNSGYKYYLVMLDDYSHFAWTFPLRHKSNVLPAIIAFHAFVCTQFKLSIMCLQTDNGRKFDNSASRAFFAAHGIVLRLTCPCTSQQNRCDERVLCTLNDSVRAMLFHSSVPTSFWLDALATATYILNHRPCCPRQHHTPFPFELLFDVLATYDHLRIFGCLCYPNIAATSPHKLTSRSLACVFLGYPTDQKGYKCYDPVSRHVYFNESVFPFQQDMTTRAAAAGTIHTTNILRTAPVPAGSSSPYSPCCSRTTIALCVTLRWRRLARILRRCLNTSPHVAHYSCSTHPSCHSSYRGGCPRSNCRSRCHARSLRIYLSASSIAATRASSHSSDDHPCAKVGIRLPNAKYANVATAPSAPLSSVRSALRNPEWASAMRDEYEALISNSTWTLVLWPPGANVSTGKWVFKNKLHPDGTLEHRKARWVVRGFNQRRH